MITGDDLVIIFTMAVLFTVIGMIFSELGGHNDKEEEDECETE